MHEALAVLLSATLAFAGADASATPTSATHASGKHAPPLGAQPEVGGARTQVLNLASTHLSQHQGWQRAWLEPLNARLVAWRPEVVDAQAVLSGAAGAR